MLRGCVPWVLALRHVCRDGCTAVGAPVVLALVDVAGCDDFVEVVKSALLALVESLPPGAQFGLITFSDRIGLHDLQGALAALFCGCAGLHARQAALAAPCL